MTTNIIVKNQTNSIQKREEIVNQEMIIKEAYELTERFNDKLLDLLTYGKPFSIEWVKVDGTYGRNFIQNTAFWDEWDKLHSTPDLIDLTIQKMTSIKELEPEIKKEIIFAIYNECQTFKVEKHFNLIVIHANLKNLSFLSVYYGIREGSLDKYISLDSIISLAKEKDNTIKNFLDSWGRHCEQNDEE